MSKEIFISNLAEKLTPAGYKYVNNKNRFIQKNKGNEYIYSFEFFTSDTIRYEPSFRIKLKEIQDIKKAAWGDLYDADYDYSVGTDKASYERAGGSGYRIGTEKEAIERAEEEYIYVTTVVTEYFRKYSDIEFLNNLINSKPGEELLVNGGHISTCFTAVIVAYLVNNPSMEELIIFYKEIVKKHNELFIEEYDLLSNFLLRGTNKN